MSQMLNIAKIRTFPILVVIFIIAVSNSSHSAEQNLNLSDDQITILSDTLRYFPEKNLAIFEGKVEATQKDTKLFCDKMSVDFYTSTSPKKSNNSKKIKKIYAQSNVIMITPEEKATSNRGELDVEKDMLYLFDQVKLYQGNNILSGDKLTYNTNTKESLVTSNFSQKNSTRVVGVFTPKDNKDN